MSAPASAVSGFIVDEAAFDAWVLSLCGGDLDVEHEEICPGGFGETHSDAVAEIGAIAVSENVIVSQDLPADPEPNFYALSGGGVLVTLRPSINVVTDRSAQVAGFSLDERDLCAADGSGRVWLRETVDRLCNEVSLLAPAYLASLSVDA
jgi:hypothetical protein